MIVSLMVSCKDDGPRKIGTNKSRAQQIEQVKVEAKDYDKFVYDVTGKIYHKEISEGCGTEYYFYIELEDGNVLEWETTAAKYVRKNVGDPVRFDYLRKSRFSNEAL